MRYLTLKQQFIVAVLMFPTLSYSHGGRTNAEGCHNNRKTGEYHCHGGGSSSKQIQLQDNYINADGNQSCGSKRTCGEMASCKEAQHYLNECGLARLDADNDGVPCESMCGN